MSIICEAFKELEGMKELEEATFNFNNDGAAKMGKFLEDERNAKPDNKLAAVDPDADSDENLKKSYKGDVLCQCCVCKGYILKNPADLVKDEATGLLNVDEECPHCLNVGGYEAVAQVKKDLDGSVSEEKFDNYVDDDDDIDSIDINFDDDDYEETEEFVDDFAGGEYEDDDEIRKDLEDLNDEEDFELANLDDDAEDLNDEEDFFEEIDSGDGEVLDDEEETTKKKKRSHRVPDLWNRVNDELEKINHTVEADETAAEEDTEDDYTFDYDEEDDEYIDDEDDEVHKALEITNDPSGAEDALNSIMVRAASEEELADAIQVAENHLGDGITYTVGMDKYMKKPHYVRITIPADKISSTGYDIVQEGITIDVSNNATEAHEGIEDSVNIDKKNKTLNIRKPFAGNIHIDLNGKCGEDEEGGDDMGADTMDDMSFFAGEAEDEFGDEDFFAGEEMSDAGAEDEEEPEVGGVLGEIEPEIADEIEASGETEEEPEDEFGGELGDEDFFANEEEPTGEEEIAAGEEETAAGEAETAEGEAEEAEEEEEETEGAFGESLDRGNYRNGEVDVKIEEFGEAAFNKLGEKYLMEVYGNVKGFTTTKGYVAQDGIIIEGLIELSDGRKARTKFSFASDRQTKSGKLKFIGENRQITKNQNAFTLTCSLDGKKLLPESLTYSYNLKKDGDTKATHIYKTVRLDK